MRKALYIIVCIVFACACTRDHGPAYDSSVDVSVFLAMSLNGSTSSKADVNYIQELANDSRFTGMQNIRLLPFSRRGEVREDDVALSEPRILPDILGTSDASAYDGTVFHQGLVKNNHAHFYPDAYAILPEGTASALVYGSGVAWNSTPTPASKHCYGSLIETGLEDVQGTAAGDIRFSPDPILSEGALSTAEEIAAMFTSIAGAATYSLDYYYERNAVWHSSQTALTWNGNIDDPTLRTLFEWFTNEGELMTGAGSNLEYMISTLRRRLDDYSSDQDDQFMHQVDGVEYPAVLIEGDPSSVFTRALLYDGLRDMLIARIDALVEDGTLVADSAGNLHFADDKYRLYPESLGLPDGSAVLRWNSLAFVPVTEGLDGIAPIDHFCYMPPLMYRSNTTLRTSGDHEIYKVYTSDRTWEQILSAYRLGNVVTKRSFAVVLDGPLQYAPGMLVASVQASNLALPDGDDDDRTYALATGTNFPVTGIIIGSQYEQKYDFTPVSSGSEYYLYDNNISGIYLTASESADFRTLVLPTPQNSDVYFFLELRNDSNSPFTGAEGIVLPGSKFYLSGVLEKSDDPVLDRIFMSDYFTTVKCTVSSLANAHISVPEMGEPQLTLGIQTKLNWIMSASAYVVLD